MWRKASRPYLLLLPAVLVLGLLFVGGLAEAVRQSLQELPVAGAPGGGAALTGKYYAEVLTSREFWAACGLSLRIALGSTLIACLLGLALAAALARGASRWATLLARLPLVVPHTVAAYLTLLWLAQSGLLARLSFHLGIIAEPQAFPALVNDGGGIGMMIAYVWKEAPFAALMLYPPLVRAGHGLLDAATTLGATRLQRWRWVILPLVGPALGAVALIIFSYTFGAYDVPSLLGQTYPRALSVAAVQRFVSPDLTDRPVAMVYNLVITAITGLAVWLYLTKVAPRLDRQTGYAGRAPS